MQPHSAQRHEEIRSDYLPEESIHDLLGVTFANVNEVDRRFEGNLRPNRES
jgi:hypothetical protein